MAHQIEDIDPQSEEEYDENADEDFNPEAATKDEDASSSEDEPETAKEAAAKQPKRAGKRKSEVLGDLDSGDEATIQERRSKKRKKETAAAEDEDSGGEGGLIKTRAQRLAEKSREEAEAEGRAGWCCHCQCGRSLGGVESYSVGKAS